MNDFFTARLTLYSIGVHNSNMAKTQSIKIRLEESQYLRLESQAKSRGVPMSAIVRELIDALPDDPPVKPIAKIVYGEWHQSVRDRAPQTKAPQKS